MNGLRRRVLLATGVAVLTGAHSLRAQAAPATHTVTIDGFEFKPPTLTVKQGGFLGVTTHGLSDRCQIDSVKVGSAAAEAGLRAGDVIIQIEQTPIASFEDLQKAISLYLPGDKVTLRYDRGGEIGEVQVTLGRLEGE